MLYFYSSLLKAQYQQKCNYGKNNKEKEHLSTYSLTAVQSTSKPPHTTYQSKKQLVTYISHLRDKYGALLIFPV